jgi:membrane protein DedA with SNARE-associated domain
VNPFQNLPGLPDLTELLQAVGDLYLTAGYAVVFVACLLGNTFIIGFFLPAGTVAALCGFLARRGVLDVGWVIAAVWAGMIVGYNIDYCLGRFVFARLADRWAATRLGRWLRLERRLQRGAALLDKHGDKAIFYAYAGLGHFRSIVAVSIGMARLSYWRFLFYQLIASLLWSLIYVFLGYFIGVETDNLSGAAERFGAIAAGIFLGIYLLWAIWSALTGEFYDPLIGRISFRRAKRRPDRSADESR